MSTRYWDDPAHHADYAQFWMAHPLIRAAINERVSGDPNVWPISALRRQLGGRAPLPNCLSIGCGMGALERSLIEQGIGADVTGIDVSDAILQEARRLAAEKQMPIRYIAADARGFLAAHPQSFDAVFFHGSLHHFDRLDELMALVAGALRRGGFVWYDEYVGPSRDEWTVGKLWPLNRAYYRLPKSMRRPRLVRAPLSVDDPTEAIASSDIVPATARRFRIASQRDYGGNILLWLYPNLRKPHEEGGPSAEVFDRWIARLIEWDADAMRRRPSWSTVITAEPRDA